MGNSPVIIVLDANENSRKILNSYLNEFYDSSKIQLFEDYNLGFEEIRKQENPIVFVDLYHENKAYEDIIEKIKFYTSKIVITSLDYSTDTIVRAMRLGAKEFLPKPIIKDELSRVVEMLVDLDVSVSDYGSKIITIYSNKGGIGKTTIATNLAVELAKSTYDKVALIDLNLQLGDVSTFLNLNPTFDVHYVIKKMLDKKEEVLLKSFEKYKNTSLYVLSDPNYIEQSESMTPQQIDALLKSLKKVFSYIVIDMSSNIDPNSLKILDVSDWILFTTIVNIPAIRNCQRCLNLFKSRRYPKDKVKVLINRYMDNDDIKIEDI